MKHWIFFLCLAHLAVFASPAATLQGTVKDQRGAALPFATVYIQASTIGTSANPSGAYQLHLEAGTYTIVCQFMGYKQATYTCTIGATETQVHDFVLQEQTLEMKAFTVKASEDPARYIMRQVIRRRKFHQNQIQAFQTDMYLKGVLRTRSAPKKIMGEKVNSGDMGLDSAGKGILYLVEEEATYYTNRNQSRTIIHSVRESGSPNGLGFSRFPPVINFFDNNIQISDQLNPRGFISPVSDNALLYYNYKLEGDFKEGNHTIYQIRVTPRRLYEPLLQGTLYIVDEDWAIHSLAMTATKTSNMEFLDTFRIEQRYLPLAPDQWVIKQQVWFPIFKFFGFEFVGSFVTVYNNQRINEALPDSVFASRFVSEYDKGANKKDTSYWKDRRPVPLEGDEIKDFRLKDSLRLVDENPRRRDSLRRIQNRPRPGQFLSSGYTYLYPKNTGVLRTNALLSGLVNYNTVEGWNVAPRVTLWRTLDTGKVFTATAAARYGFDNTHANGIARLSYTHYDRTWRRRSRGIELEGGKYVFQLNPYNPIDPLYNSVATLFYRKNYLKIHERWTATITYRRNVGNGVNYSLSAGWQKRLPLENSTDYTLAKGDVGGLTSNYPDDLNWLRWERHQALVLHGSLSWTPGFSFIKYPDYIAPVSSDYPTLTVSYQKGLSGILGSKTNYDKWRVGVTDDFSMKLLGRVSYNVSAGGFLNDQYVSVPDLNHLYGNQLLVATPYVSSFQQAPYYQFSNARPFFSEAHVEWYLQGFLTNKIPVMRQLRWYLVAGANSYYADQDLWHTEFYGGIDNLGLGKFRVFRLDYVWGRNSVTDGSLHAFRIGISPTSLIGSDMLRANNSDW